MLKCFLILPIVFLAVVLTGCNLKSDTPKYQLINTADGKVYRLDNDSGVVHYISPNKMTELHDGTPLLEIGDYYEMPDASKGEEKYLKYLGNGKFEESEYAIIKEN